MPLSLEELLQEAGTSASSNKQLLAQIGEMCVSAWRSRVSEELPDNTLKTAYLGQLQVLSVTEDSVTFGLPGGREKPAVLAYIAENGMTAHDMNEYLTRNGRTSWLFRGKVVQSKQGKVAFIPMEKTHNKITEQAATADATAALRAIKALSPTTESTNRAGERVTQWGGRLGAGFGRKLKESHKHDALFRMVRIVATYSYNEKDRKPNTGSRYTLFRTVTENGKRWHRTETPAAQIAAKVLELDVPRILDGMLETVAT